MTKVVAVATSQIEYVCEDNTIDKLMVTTKAYDDGRVIQQYGEGGDWVQICDPDEWEPVPGEDGEPEEEEIKAHPGKCTVCDQLFKPGQIPMLNAKNQIVHKAGDCEK